MSTINPELYIKRNAPYTVMWAIRDYLWSNKPLSITIQKFFDYLSEYHFCDPFKYIETVKSILEQVKDVSKMKRLLLEDRETYISPSYRTLNDYIKGEFREDMTIEKLCNVVCELMEGYAETA